MAEFDELLASKQENPKARQQLEDMAWIVSDEPGLRYMQHVLECLAFGRQIHECEVSRYNLAVRILSDICRASPAQGLKLLARLYNI